MINGEELGSVIHSYFLENIEISLILRFCALANGLQRRNSEGVI